MKNWIKKFSKKTKLGNNVIFQYSLNFYYVLRHLMISDEQMIKKKFKKSFGYDINLNRPKTYNEKIQWLKLNDRTPLHTQCADKFKVRQYIFDKIGGDHLVPLIFETKDLKDINPNNLPDFPIIIKTNHDSSNVFIIKDKSKVDWKNIKAILSREIKKNYYYSTQEWQYKNIERRIIVENLLFSENEKLPVDCKIHCFHGKAKLISIDIDRGLLTHCRSFYDQNWNRVELHFSSVNIFGATKVKYGGSTEKPRNIDKIISLSEKLSEEFIYVRVDWLYIDDRFYNGEMTFHSDNGLSPLKPDKWNRKLGDYISLPIYN